MLSVLVALTGPAQAQTERPADDPHQAVAEFLPSCAPRFAQIDARVAEAGVGDAETAAECVALVESTQPDANGATHWGQQAFYLSPGISAADGAVIEGRLEMQRKKENQRLYDVRLTWRQGDGEKMNDAVGERQNVWHIE